MKTLLEKSKINKPKLKRILTKATAQNLSRLSEPCFYPHLFSLYNEFLRSCGLTEKDVKEFTKRRWHGRKEAKFFIQSEPKANFYIFLMHYFLLEKDQTGYRTAMLFFVIRYYANLMKIYFEYCNEAVFKYALERLARTHLFVREKTISNALYYISQEMIRRWTKDLEEENLDRISKFMQECRHRIEQSLQSFARAYYKASKEGAGLKTQLTPSDDEENAYQYQTIEKKVRAIDEITRKITVYKYVDKSAQTEAKKVTRASSELANLVSVNLTNLRYIDNIRITLQLFIKDLKDVDMICGKTYFQYVRKLMSKRGEKTTKSFKHHVNVLLLKVLEDINYKERYDKLTSQTKLLVSLFLAYYLTMIFRNTVCQIIPD